MLANGARADSFQVLDRQVGVKYSELRLLSRTRRFSAEIELGPQDFVVLDGDSMLIVESRVRCFVAPAIYARMLLSQQK